RLGHRPGEGCGREGRVQRQALSSGEGQGKREEVRSVRLGGGSLDPAAEIIRELGVAAVHVAALHSASQQGPVGVAYDAIAALSHARILLPLSSVTTDGAVVLRTLEWLGLDGGSCKRQVRSNDDADVVEFQSLASVDAPHLFDRR